MDRGNGGGFTEAGRGGGAMERTPCWQRMLVTGGGGMDGAEALASWLGTLGENRGSLGGRGKEGGSGGDVWPVRLRADAGGGGGGSALGRGSVLPTPELARGGSPKRLSAPGLLSCGGGGSGGRVTLEGTSKPSGRSIGGMDCLSCAPISDGTPPLAVSDDWGADAGSVWAWAGGGRDAGSDGAGNEDPRNDSGADAPFTPSCISFKHTSAASRRSRWVRRA